MGNKRFRSLCFSRKAEFEAGNLAGTSANLIRLARWIYQRPKLKVQLVCINILLQQKKRIAMEIVQTMISRYHTRFLKQTKQGWLCLSTEQGTAVQRYGGTTVQRCGVLKQLCEYRQTNNILTRYCNKLN